MPELVFDPELWGNALSGIANLLNWQAAKSTASSIKQIYKLLQDITAVEVRFIIAMFWWVAHLAAAVSDIDTNTNAISDDIKTLTANEKDAWTELLNTKLPADLQALYKALSGHTDQKTTAVAKAAKVNLKPIEQEIAALELWKKNVVTPALTDWKSFYALWRSTYVKPVTTLTVWLKSPSQFARWATPPILPQAVSLFGTKQYLPLAQNLSILLANTWASNPDAIGQAVNQLMSASA